MTKILRASTLSIAIAFGAAGCGDAEVNDSAVAVYPDPYYGYAYYYPADLIYSDPYMVDGWYSYPYYYADTQPLTAPAGSGPGAYLRALASGEELCPGHVDFEPRERDLDCDEEDDQGETRTGASVDFDDCELGDGSVLDGSFEITSERTYSDEDCAPDTIVTVSFTSHYDDLSYTAPDGTRFVVPELRSSGAYTRMLADRPVVVSFTSSGSFEHYDATGELVTEVSIDGSQAAELGASGDDWTYRLYGALLMQDELNGRSLTVAADDLERVEGCCHPTAGTLRISGTGYETASVSYGPECGDATLNGDVVRLRECR